MATVSPARSATPPSRDHVLQPLDQPARQLRQRRTGLRTEPRRLLQRQRQIAEQIGHPVRHHRIDPCKPVGQQRHRLRPRQCRYLHRRARPTPAGPPRGHQQPAPPVRRPQRRHRRRILDIVEDQQPRPATAPQLREHRRRLRPGGQLQRLAQLSQPASNQIRPLRRHPPHHVELVLMPVGVLNRQRRLTDPTHPGQRHHRHRSPRGQFVGQLRQLLLAAHEPHHRRRDVPHRRPRRAIVPTRGKDLVAGKLLAGCLQQPTPTIADRAGREQPRDLPPELLRTQPMPGGLATPGQVNRHQQRPRRHQVPEHLSERPDLPARQTACHLRHPRQHKPTKGARPVTLATSIPSATRTGCLTF